ncbi:MAG TPA: DUF4124 domain-containing protein [Dongiaceae bacterium]|nr:DUF4124 domain-containing protein [Dongiaceae bacterium]
MTRTFACVLCLLIPFGASAAVYKWVDEKGVTHFGSIPPQQQQTEQVDIKVGSGASPSAGASQEQAPPSDAQQVAREMAEGLMKNTAPAEKMDCAEAVENGRYSIDSMLEVGRKNHRDGYIEKDQYEKTVSELKRIKAKLSVGECASANGNVRDFYLCLSNPMNMIAACGSKHNYQ